jgi:PAS domain S-box-containing protein
VRAAVPDPRWLRERPRRGWLGLAGGLLIVVGLAALDASWGATRVVALTVIIGPFLTALLAPARPTAVVGAVALVAILLSGTWNDNFGQDAYWLRTGVGVVGAALAALAAGARERVAEDRRRFALLVALADVGDGTETLEETVRLVGDLLVPAFADVAVVDFVQQSEVQRLGVRVAGPRADEFERWLLARRPEESAVDISSRAAVAAGRAQLVERLDSELVLRYARDEIDAEMLVALGGRSSMNVPLRARGRALGALSLSMTETSGRRYTAADADFAEVLAGRVALALDNAGLFSELETTEAQLTAALGALSDAVTVQTPQGRLLYANEAASRSLGFSSARELMSTPPERIANRFAMFSEDGSPLELDDLPGQRVLAGEQPAPMPVRWVDRKTSEERWSIVKSTAVYDRGGNPALAVNVAEDVTELKRVELAQRLLARTGEVLASSLDYEHTLQQVAELAVPELGDWCGVSLPDRHGYLRQVAVAHADAEKVRFARELSERYPARVDDPAGGAQVLRDAVPQVINDISEEVLRASAKDDEHYQLLSQLGMRAGMIVPLLVGGRAIGTLTLVSAESGRAFSGSNVELALELGRRAGTAVENARLYTERSNIAETLQAGLLPQPLPEMPGWNVASLYRPAGEENWVGGDFYDAYPVRDGWLVVVGDVAGRGAAAAALTALARYTLRAVAQLLDDPLDAVPRLNEELYIHGRGGLCTLGCAHLRQDGDEGVATVLCAGHPKPFVVRGRRAEQVGRFGPIVGAFSDVSWERVTVRLSPGDVLVLYTDGVIDTVGESERFGENRLADVVATGAGDVTATIRGIDQALRDFARGAQADDTAVVAVRRTVAVPEEDTAAAGMAPPSTAPVDGQS